MVGAAMSEQAGPPATAPGGYYGQGRLELLAELPRPIGRVLDIGCGAGGVGIGLKAAGAERLVGIELMPDAAAVAAEVYDEVLVGAVTRELERLTGPFDTICCYDVLEHLEDPYAVLAGLLEHAAPGARLHVSVPNARHVSLVRDLVFRGTFGYTDWGHRDRTHLRWFTPRDIAGAIAAAGWQVTAQSHPPMRRGRLLDRLTGGWSTQFLAGQWFVLARAPG
jgi:2-polyprenyl-3-methyl-5-hydroxy-6-metoxy-1,4-benzoquinol methylase